MHCFGRHQQEYSVQWEEVTENDHQHVHMTRLLLLIVWNFNCWPVQWCIKVMTTAHSKIFEDAQLQMFTYKLFKDAL